MFSKGIILSEGRIAGVHAVLHELVKVGIGAVKDINATGSDLAVDSGKFSVDDVPQGPTSANPVLTITLSKSTRLRSLERSCNDSAEGRVGKSNLKLARGVT